MEFILLVCLAAFALGLGFFALLKQKTYLDASGTVTSVEVPFVGKMHTNYPALLFVFIGFAFGYLAYHFEVKTKEAREIWTATTRYTVEGRLKSDENVTDWLSTDVMIIPSSLTHQEVDRAGQYRIVVEVPKWQSFGDWLGAISFQNGKLSGRISPGSANHTAAINKETNTYMNADVKMQK
jgi:hypothetical protein